MAAQDLQRAAVGLPDAGGAVARGGDDALAGNRELGGVDGVGVAAQDLLGADVGAEDAKHAGGAVVASGDDPLAVGAERRDVDGAVVAAQDRGRRVGLCGGPDQVAEIATPAAEGRAPGGQRAGHAGLPAGRPQRGPGSRPEAPATTTAAPCIRPIARTGVRDTPCCSASVASSSAQPGGCPPPVRSSSRHRAGRSRAARPPA